MLLGRSWGARGALLSVLRPIWGALGRSWAHALSGEGYESEDNDLFLETLLHIHSSVNKSGSKQESRLERRPKPSASA